MNNCIVIIYNTNISCSRWHKSRLVVQQISLFSQDRIVNLLEYRRSTIVCASLEQRTSVKLTKLWLRLENTANTYSILCNFMSNRIIGKWPGLLTA